MEATATIFNKSHILQYRNSFLCNSQQSSDNDIEVVYEKIKEEKAQKMQTHKNVNVIIDEWQLYSDEEKTNIFSKFSEAVEIQK